MHRSPYRAILIALILAIGSFAVAACGSSDNNTTSSSAGAGSTSTAAEPAAKKIKVGLVTDIGGLNDRSFNALANKGLEDAKSQLGIDGRVLISKSNADYVPNLTHAGPAEVRPRHRGRLPHGRRDREGRQEVPGREVRDHRLVGGGHEEQAQERRGPAVLRAGGRLPRRLPLGPVRQGQQRHDDRQRRRPEDPAGRPLHRGLPGRAPRRPTRRSRRSTPTPRTSSTRRSARRSRWTRSPRARRSSSRSRASAASASSTRPRRRASRASAWTPTRPTWARRCSPARSRRSTSRCSTRSRRVQDDKYTGGQDVINSVKSGGIGYGKLNAAAEKYADQVKQVQDEIASGEIANIPDTVK